MTIKVNGEVVPEQAVQYELDRLVKFYSEYMSPAKINAQMDLLKSKAKDQAIGVKLLLKEVERLDIKVTAEDIDKRMKIVFEKAGGKEGFERLLKKRGITEDSVRKSLERGAGVDLLVERISQEAAEPTEDEILEHFRQHADEYKKSDRVQVRHILIKFDARNKADRETALSGINEIRQKILEGADFEDQAAAHSDCPSGKKSGGNLGWLSSGMTVPGFDRAMFAMKVGELSEVLETPLGFHIISKTAHEPGGEADFDDVREKIREFLRHVHRGEVLTAYVNDLKKKAVIEEV